MRGSGAYAFLRPAPCATARRPAQTARLQQTGVFGVLPGQLYRAAGVAIHRPAARCFCRCLSPTDSGHDGCERIAFFAARADTDTDYVGHAFAPGMKEMPRADSTALMPLQASSWLPLSSFPRQSDTDPGLPRDSAEWGLSQRIPVGKTEKGPGSTPGPFGMVPPPRLERGTPRSTIWCSNQLS